MKRNIRILPFIMLMLLSSAVYSQILEPVTWSFDTKKISDDVVELQLKATMDKGWHLYSQDVPKGGPIATTFNFDKSDNYRLIGDTKEPTPIEEYDKNFEMVLKFFDNSVTFRQRIKVTSEDDFTIEGELEYMCCDDKSCLPPDYVDFSFDIKGVEGAQPQGSQAEEGDPQTDEQADAPTEDTNGGLDETVAEEKLINYGDTSEKAVTTAEVPETELWKPVIDQVKAFEDEESERSQSWWVIFFLGFIGGLIALLTPCVWPMIPMTVSFFLKRSGDHRAKGVRDAVIYGLGIIVIYVSIGLGITLAFGADALNSLSTNAFFNLLFFLLLVIFAIAFFGGFELTLPASWTNAMDSRADKTSGLLSIFFMAFTLALVSFSCTGPIIGTLLVEAAISGARLGPFMGMLGFSVALAVPFTVFAIFPSWLNSMPKSGGWLNSVKVVLGFLELALAFKFLSVADLSYHWGLLDRDVFLAIWIVIFTLLGLYLLGKIRFPHDSDMKRIPVFSLFLAIASLSFAAYMVPGMWGAPVKAVAAFAPPPLTQDFSLYESEVHAKFTDYEQGMEYARQVNKPVIIDFTGWGCVNCRKMENSVWTDPRVKDMLENDYVLISLYVDDKQKLPESEIMIITESGKERKLNTVGRKWSYLQRVKFGTNSQPFYVILDNQGNLLIKPHAYDKSVKKYVEWLQKGLKEFREQQNSNNKQPVQEEESE